MACSTLQSGGSDGTGGGILHVNEYVRTETSALSADRSWRLGRGPTDARSLPFPPEVGAPRIPLLRVQARKRVQSPLSGTSVSLAFQVRPLAMETEP